MKPFYHPSFVGGVAALIMGYLIGLVEYMIGGVLILIGIGLVYNAMAALCIRAYERATSPYTRVGMVMVAALIFLMVAWAIMQIFLIGLMASLMAAA